MMRFLKKSLCLLVSTCLLVSPLAGEKSGGAEPLAAGAKKLLLTDLLKEAPAALVPSELGTVREIYRGKGDRVVVYFEDAHANPQAQRSLEKLTSFFQTQYDVNTLALEGTSEPLAPLFFRSFPDAERLKYVFEGYLGRGELSGAAAASVLNLKETEFFGLEDWPLYENGVKVFLEAVQAKSSFEKDLLPLEKKLAVLQQAFYNPKALKATQAIKKWQAGKLSLDSFLSELDSLQPLSSGSYPVVSTLFQMLKQEQQQRESLKPAIALWAGQIQNRFKFSRGVPEFNQKLQEWQTGFQDDGDFALYLSAFSGKNPPPAALTGLLELHRRFKSMQSDDFFAQLDRWQMDIKEKVLVTAEERELDRSESFLFLLKKLSSLELSSQELAALEVDLKAASPVKAGAVEVQAFAAQLREWIQTHGPDRDLFTRFYAIAKARDKVFWKKIQALLKTRKQCMLLTGGFHKDALTAKMKKAGISYVRIQPAFQRDEQDDRYSRFMQGHVSWEQEFKLVHGRISLFDAFARAVVKQLLPGPAGSETQMKTAQLWRDRLLTELSRQNRMSHFDHYRRLLEEGLAASLDSDRLEALKTGWAQRLERFFSSAEQPSGAAALTSHDFENLLNRPANQFPAAAASLSEGATLFDFRQPALAAVRSEVRREDVELDSLISYLGLPSAGRAAQSPLTALLRRKLREGLDPFTGTLLRLKNKLRAADRMTGVVNVALFEATRDEPELRERLSHYFSVLNELSKNEPQSMTEDYEEGLKTIRFLGVGDIVTVSPEAEHAKAGGMADVIAELSPALVKAGGSVEIITFLYRDRKPGAHEDIDTTVQTLNLKRQPIPVSVYVGPTKKSGGGEPFPGTEHTLNADAFLEKRGDLRTVYLYHPDKTKVLYPPDLSGKEYLELAILLSRGALEYARKYDQYPGWIFTNDWMASLVPLYLKADAFDISYRQDPHLRNTRTVAVGHNMGDAYQMRIYTNEHQWGTDVDLFPTLNVGGEHYGGIADHKDHSRVNLVQANMFHADEVLVVSPGYLTENLQPGSASGLDWLLRSKEAEVFGISNGLGEQWIRDFDRVGRQLAQMPEFSGGDSDLERNYQGNLAEYKAAAKRVVQKKYDGSDANYGKSYFGTFDQAPNKPLLGMVARLAEQKGIELFIEGARKMLEESDVQLLIVGSVPNEPIAQEFKRAMLQLAADEKYKGRFVFNPEFTKPNTRVNVHEIFLSLDGFLMPSKDEPGGIAQLQALLAGAAVIGRSVGGIANTVREFDAGTRLGDGFLFNEFTTERLTATVKHAADTLQNAEFRAIIQQNATTTDNSWDNRVPYYIAMLQKGAGVLDYDYPHLQGVSELLNRIQPHLPPNPARSEIRKVLPAASGETPPRLVVENLTAAALGLKSVSASEAAFLADAAAHPETWDRLTTAMRAVLGNPVWMSAQAAAVTMNSREVHDAVQFRAEHPVYGTALARQAAQSLILFEKETRSVLERLGSDEKLHFSFAMPFSGKSEIQEWQSGLMKIIQPVIAQNRAEADIRIFASSRDLEAAPGFFEKLKDFSFVKILMVDAKDSPKAWQEFVTRNENALVFDPGNQLKRQVPQKERLIGFSEPLLWDDIYPWSGALILKSAQAQAGITAEFLKQVYKDSPQGLLRLHNGRLEFLSTARNLLLEMDIARTYAIMA